MKFICTCGQAVCIQFIGLSFGGSKNEKGGTVEEGLPSSMKPNRHYGRA